MSRLASALEGGLPPYPQASLPGPGALGQPRPPSSLHSVSCEPCLADKVQGPSVAVDSRAQLRCHGNPLADRDLGCYGNLSKTQKYLGGGVSAKKKGDGDHLHGCHTAQDSVSPSQCPPPGAWGLLQDPAQSSWAVVSGGAGRVPKASW